MNPQPPVSVGLAQIDAAHALYCQLTGQNLRLAYDRQRAWYELLRTGFTLDDIRRVIRYLQREIRCERRNVGALKLRNLLQVDQFEEDLNISRVLLAPQPKRVVSTPLELPPPMNPEQLQRKRSEVAQQLIQLRESL